MSADTPTPLDLARSAVDRAAAHRASREADPDTYPRALEAEQRAIALLATIEERLARVERADTRSVQALLASRAWRTVEAALRVELGAAGVGVEVMARVARRLGVGGAAGEAVPEMRPIGSVDGWVPAEHRR